MSAILFGPVPHSEAAAFIRQKPVVSRAVFDQMLPEVKARTFLVSGLVPLDVAQKLRDRIAEIPLGGDWDTAKREIAGSLTPFLKSDDDKADLSAVASAKAELLLRTHGYQSYAAAQYEVMDRQRDVFPYWRYQTAQDDRVRDSHAALEGVVLPASDPFWQTHFPPWDFNCRCTVVPLSEADVAEIATEDAGKPAEQRSLLSDQERARMNTDGTLVRGPNQIVDVRSPRQKRDGDGYAWQPGDLRLPLETLRERYSPEVFAAFEAFSKNTKLDDGRTLHAWLEGETAPPAAPAVAGRALRSPEGEAGTSPVSRVFNLAGNRTAAKPAMQAALTAIDRVHDDGVLPAIDFTSRPVPGALGHFDYRKKEIAVAAKGPWPQMTATHEAGHLIDMFAMGNVGQFASDLHVDLAPWRAAATASAAVKQIEGGAVAGLRPNQRSYLLRPREIWARSYAQYIAQKSGEPELLRQLDLIRQTPIVGHVLQWSDADFAPIALAIDELFAKKGWRAPLA